MINVDDVKKKIIDFLKANGPALPIRISSHVKLEPVFTAAILSELSSVKKVELSNMRVGSSRIYYIKGQEQGLEKFADEHLSGVVKRAYMLLKENKYIVDVDQEPAVRVALRSLKDFAIAFQYGEKIMWRYAFTSKEEILRLIENPSNSSEEVKEEKLAEQEIKEEPKPKTEEKKEPDEINDKKSISESVDNKEEPESKIEEEKETNETHKISEEKQKSLFNSPFEKETKESDDKMKSKKPEKKEEKASQFDLTQEVKEFLDKRNISFVEDIEETKSEYTGIIEITTQLGKMQLLVIAKNRKSINDSDILAIKQKSTEQNMPCLFLHKGKLTKRGEEVIEQNKNLIKTYKID